MFMTAMQIINMCFYLLVYPLLIRRLGAESYGLYAFAWSVVTIAAAVVSFGFDLLGTKKVSEIMANVAEDDQHSALNEVLSAITIAKTGLLIAVGLIYAILLWIVPWLLTNWVLFGIAFFQVGVTILFPQWYYQGVQRMGVVTYIQLAVKIATLPLIWWLVKDSTDTWVLMLITVLGGWVGGLVCGGMLRWKEHLKMIRVSGKMVGAYYKESFPLFLTNIMSIIKEQGVVMLVGGCLGMRDVAIYDLANKIVTVPRIMLLQINNALFPKIVVQRNAEAIRKIMRFETGISLCVVVLIAAVGKWCAILLGGNGMVEAWPVSIVLSATILCWMIGTAYIDFVFIPTGNNQLVAWNQLVALLSFALVGGLGMVVAPSVYVVVGALVVSGISEMIFCSIINRKLHLMETL